MVTASPTRNCNVIYLDGLQAYDKHPEKALLSAFTNKVPQYFAPTQQARVTGPPTYTQWKCGIVLFALGSETPTSKYAHTFRDYIQEHQLGTVFEMPPVVNPLHNNKKGVLFVWIPDWKTLGEWWVLQPDADKLLASHNQL